MVDTADFCVAKEDFLRQYLELLSSLPCHNTFSRLFRMIQPAAFEVLFDKFREDFAQVRDEIKTIAMDGKEICRALQGRTMPRQFCRSQAYRTQHYQVQQGKGL